MSSRASIRHWAEYLAFRAAAALCAALPPRVGDFVGGGLGRLGYVLRIRRSVAEQQLRDSFPEQSAEWIDRVTRRAYTHLGREMIAMLRTTGLSARQVVALARENPGSEMERLLEYVRAGSGVVLATAHVGNWEVAGAGMTARGVPLDVVVVKQANPLFDRLIVRTRARLGMRVIYKRNAPREALAALRAGRVVAFVSDQDARTAGVFVPFFGRMASTPRGAALMAVRTGSPLFVGYALRAKDGGYEGAVQEIHVSRDGELDDVVERLTAAFTAKLEQVIRSAPEQYLWQHRRWKTRYIGAAE